MPLIPSTTNEKPSNSETKVDDLDTEAMTQKIEQAMEASTEEGGNRGGKGGGSSALEETKAGVAQTASEVEKAANKLYEERIEGEYAKREGGA